MVVIVVLFLLFCSLMQKMIVVDPQKRVSLDEVVSHPWLKQVCIYPSFTFNVTVTI